MATFLTNLPETEREYINNAALNTGAQIYCGRARSGAAGSAWGMIGIYSRERPEFMLDEFWAEWRRLRTMLKIVKL